MKKKPTTPGKKGPKTIGTFYDYTIGIDALKDHDSNGYQKLIMTVRLDDIGDPSGMDLYYFEAQTGGGTVGGSVYQMTETTNPATFDHDVMISNNELVLSDYKKGSTDVWEDFDYLLLTPTNMGGSLAFNVKAYKNGTSGSQQVNLPKAQARYTKPSPPAKPEYFRKDK